MNLLDLSKVGPGPNPLPSQALGSLSRRLSSPSLTLASTVAASSISPPILFPSIPVPSLLFARHIQPRFLPLFLPPRPRLRYHFRIICKPLQIAPMYRSNFPCVPELTPGASFRLYEGICSPSLVSRTFQYVAKKYFRDDPGPCKKKLAIMSMFGLCRGSLEDGLLTTVDRPPPTP